jgi:serine/threonine-protein kinase
MNTTPTPFELNLPFQIGATIAGKYRIDRSLGAGGMGYVFAGMHVALGQKVAIKVLKPTVQTAEYVTRFEREARAAARLRSEHIVRVLDVGHLDGGLPYMVMEYLRGQDLAQMLRERGPIPVGEALDYMLQACEALAEAHRAGIIHRDLKPANLFVTQATDGSPLVKVLDFGISKFMQGPSDAKPQELTESQTVIGSPHYMSPEQLKSARDVDGRTDIWALGSVLYKLLTGALPFEAESQAELCVEILISEPQPMRKLRPELSEAVEAIVLKCLEKKPADRWQSMGELAAALVPHAPPRSQSAAERISRMVSMPEIMPSDRPPPSDPEIGIPIDAGTVMTASTSVKEPTFLPLPVAPRPKKWMIGGGLAGLLVIGVLAVALAGSAPKEATVTPSATTSAAAAPPPAASSALPAEPAAPQVTSTADPAPSVTASAAPRPTAVATHGPKPRPTATANAKPPGGTLDFGGRK